MIASRIAGLQWREALCLILLLHRSDNFIGQLRQLYRSCLIKSSEPSVFTIGLLVIFLAGLSGIFRRLLRLLWQARQSVAAGAGNTYKWVFRNRLTSWPNSCSVLICNELWRSTPADWVGCLLTSTSAFYCCTSQLWVSLGQPGLTAFSCWLPCSYSDQVSWSADFGNNVFIG